MGESDPYRVLELEKTQATQKSRERTGKNHANITQTETKAILLQKRSSRKFSQLSNLSALNKPEENTTKESKWKICSEEEIHSEVETHLVDANPFGGGGMGGLDDMISQMFGGGGMPRQAPPFKDKDNHEQKLREAKICRFP